jgi:DNA-directed RNA polymerase specialized sigma24 family protein
MLDPPDRVVLEALHTRLCGGDRVASGELVRLLLPYLSAAVADGCPRIDEQLINDGVVDALLDYCATPGQFDPARGVPLEGFLRTAARRNVANVIRGERRRKGRERKVGSEKRELTVADDPAAGNIRQEDLARLAERRAAILAALTSPADRDVIVLWLDGVRDSSDYAAVLHITHLPTDEQRAEVERQKERILRFLRRRGLIS